MSGRISSQHGWDRLTEATLLAPSFLAALTFEYADRLPIARVQYLILQNGLRIAALAPAVFTGLRIGDAFTHG